jgi:hypothetical protein
MAKRYRRGLITRLVNRWFWLLTNLGVGASYRHFLTLRGDEAAADIRRPST